MIIQVPYGRSKLEVEPPDSVDVVKGHFVPGLAGEPAALQAALRSPIGSTPLAEKVKPGDRVVIVHSDITRATPNDRILPVLLAEIEAAGFRREDITLLNGLGTHRPRRRPSCVPCWATTSSTATAARSTTQTGTKTWSPSA